MAYEKPQFCDQETFNARKLIKSTQVWKGAANNGEPAYVMRVEYEATNGFGASSRTCQLVGFSTKNGRNYNYTQQAMDGCSESIGNTAEIQSMIIKNILRRNNFS